MLAHVGEKITESQATKGTGNIQLTDSIAVDAKAKRRNSFNRAASFRAKSSIKRALRRGYIRVG